MIVEDILYKDGLENCKLVAGEDGLSRKITSISVLEVSDERIKAWVLEGEVYITSFYSITDDVNMQKKVITALNDAHASALVLCHFDIFLKKLDKSIIELCNSMDFPLIIAQTTTSYVDIMNPIYDKLNVEEKDTDNGQLNLLKESINFINSTNNFYEILAFFEKKNKHPLYFFDIEDNLLYPEKSDITDSLSLLYKEKCSDISTNELTHFNYKGKAYLGKNIIDDSLIKGYVIAETQGSFSQTEDLFDIISIANYLVESKSAKISESKKINEKNFVQNLINWAFRSYDSAISYAKTIGWDLSKTSHLMIINLDFIQDQNSLNDSEVSQYIDEKIVKNLKNMFRPEDECYIVGLDDMTVLFLDSTWSEKDVDNFINKVRNYFKENDLEKFSIGISDSYNNITEIQEAFKEAELAYKIGRLFSKSNSKMYYNKVRSFTNLNLKFSGFKNSPLKESLIKEDSKLGVELYDTVCQMVLNDFEIDGVADALYVHKNTVYHRNQKIEKFLGYDPYKMPYLYETIVDVLQYFLG